MQRALVLGIAVVVLLTAAVAARVHDAPYIAFVEGERATATDGLRRKAENGDGYAAFLVAKNYSQGVLGTPDRTSAADWYLSAARLGEIRAIPLYIDLALTSAVPTPDQCRASVAVLELVGRTGEASALTMLGRYYETGLCVEADLVTAARYYMGSARIDGRFNDLVDPIVARLGNDAARDLRAIPEKFDAKPSAALAQFLATAPAMTAKAAP